MLLRLARRLLCRMLRRMFRALLHRLPGRRLRRQGCQRLRTLHRRLLRRVFRKLCTLLWICHSCWRHRMIWLLSRLLCTLFRKPRRRTLRQLHRKQLRWLPHILLRKP